MGGNGANCLNKPSPWISNGGVGGDPITYFGDMETKFVLPIGKLTTLLRTGDFVLQATAFAGEKESEQCIDRVLVLSPSGERIVEVSISPDIAEYRTREKLPDALETLQVRVPWRLDDKLLTLPSNEHDLIHWDGLMFNREPLRHRDGITIDLFRVKNHKSIDDAVPKREGILITSSSSKITVASTSALEFYF